MLLDSVPLERHDDYLPHVDYATQLRASRRIEVDIAAVASAIGHDPESLALDCLVFAGSGGSRLDRVRRLVDRQQLHVGASSVSIEVSVPGADLSRSLTLTTELVLGKASKPATRLAPSLPGSRLWRDERRFSIEPAGPRFPIEAVHFRSVLGAEFANALWFLDWSIGDLSLEFGSAVRLWVNADATDFVARVHEADELSLRAMMGGISAQMLRSALHSDIFEEQTDAENAASLGGVLRDWIDRCFPGQEIANVRTLAEFDPGRFEATVAGSLGA